MQNNPKEIHVIVKYFYPVAAGIETNILETYSVLAANGWDITIHTSKDTLTEKNVLKKRDSIKGLKIKRYDYKWYGFMPKINWLKADIVCLHNYNIFPHTIILFQMLWLKLLSKKKFPVVVTPHGGFNPEWSIFPKIQALVKEAIHLTLGRFLINATVDGVRAVSVWERNELMKSGIHKYLIATIPNGVENEAYADLETEASQSIKDQVKSFGTYFIQIGRIYSIKNYETTIRALALLPSHINYVIAGPVGDENYYSSLKKLISSLGLQKRIFFVGVIRGVDKYYLIKHAKMMVHMAIWESFCNVVHEGMSQGLVCIVANNTALPLLIKDGENGYCVETHDSKTVAEKIKFVIDNYESPLIQEIQSKNRTYGLAHSWVNVAHEMEAFYDSLIIKSKKNKAAVAATVTP